MRLVVAFALMTAFVAVVGITIGTQAQREINATFASLNNSLERAFDK